MTMVTTTGPLPGASGLLGASAESVLRQKRRRGRQQCDAGRARLYLGLGPRVWVGVGQWPPAKISLYLAWKDAWIIFNSQDKDLERSTSI